MKRIILASVVLLSSVFVSHATYFTCGLCSSGIFTGSSFSVGGSTFVVKGGNVGIGTQSPAYALDVVGNIRLSQPMISGSASYLINDSSKKLLWRIAGTKTTMLTEGTNELGIAIQDITGNVGIGTSTPSQKLEVAGVILSSATTAIKLSPLSATALIQYYNTSGVNDWSLYAEQSADKFHIRDSEAGANRLTVDGATGYVGIGTTSPGISSPVAGLSMSNTTISISTATAWMGGGVDATGAHFVWLKNQTGHTSVLGELVERSLNYDFSVTTTAANSASPFGVTLDAGVAVGSWMRVAVAGTCQVLFANSSGNITADQTGLVITSSTVGRAVYSTTPGASHDQEIGHPVVATATIGTGTLVWCNLHWR